MKKSNLIGHNRPPRKHNYPKNRKPPKNKKSIVETIYGIDDRPWRLPEPEVFLKMNQKTRNKQETQPITILVILLCPK